ncbi:MAG: type II toxin-antitoxin system VapC family toxin [Ferrovibrio sp.]|nr:type II toxin-antitoxin system VapC family toxin [Ferrovibrio sp.]
MADAILVDTNLLLDLTTDDPRWADWSQQQLERWSLTHRLLINPVIYAEFSIGFERIEDLDETLDLMRIDSVEIPSAALFLAGKAFRSFRKRGGKGGVLPDFFIGAHAAVVGLPLLSRDKGRFKSYFPTLELITP